MIDRNGRGQIGAEKLTEYRAMSHTKLSEKLLTVRDAAGICGINRATVYELAQRGLWGPEKLHIGRSARYRQSELLAWIEAGMPPRAKWEKIYRLLEGRVER